MSVRDPTAPGFIVKVAPEGSKAERVDLADRVTSFVFEDSEKKADRLLLTVNNWDLRNFDDPVWRKGNLLEVSWGYPGDMAPAREVVIRSVKGFQTLTVEGLAKSVLMDTVRRCRTFENLSRADIARQIAEENGYGRTRQDIEDTGEVLPVVTQARMTDAQFLRRLAAREGFQFFVDFDGLHFHTRRLGQKPVRVLRWFTPPEVGEVISINIENDVTAKPGAVSVRGRDPLRKKDIRESGSNEETKRDGLAPVLEIIDTRTGESTLQRRTASEEVRPSSRPTAEGARREAAARYRGVQQTTVRLTATILGDPSLLAKTVVEIQGISQRLSGKYYIKEAKHRIDSSGYTVEIKCLRDGHSEVGGARAKSRQNTKPAADRDALQPVDVIDRRTGETQTVWRDSRGRSGGVEDIAGGVSRPTE